jgi:hypothetical protein
MLSTKECKPTREVARRLKGIVPVDPSSNTYAGNQAQGRSRVWHGGIAEPETAAVQPTHYRLFFAGMSLPSVVWYTL